MPNNQFHNAISAPRFNRYLAACNNNHLRAEKLYRANIRLAQQLYAVIGIFEVVLRNSIDQHFTKLKGEFWLEEAVEPGGFLDVTGCEDAFHNVHDAIFKLKEEYTHERLIAKLTLGFWVYQFAAKEYAAAGSTLIAIFMNRPFNTNQKKIFQNLIRVNEIRNRIAHYEPLCFEKNEISTEKIEKRYSLIIESLRWMGYDPAELLYQIDKTEKAITMIKAMKKYNNWRIDNFWDFISKFGIEVK